MIVGGEGVTAVEKGLRLEGIKTRRFDDDVMIEGYLMQKQSLPLLNNDARLPEHRTRGCAAG
jgi:hypothetical protein